MTVTIYHNPRCSKSRKTLELIRHAGIEPRVIEYLADPPDSARLRELARLVGEPLNVLVRRGEPEFREASDRPDVDDEEALARWLEDHPIVIQRPIVVAADGKKAIIGRPPENVLGLLDEG